MMICLVFPQDEREKRKFVILYEKYCYFMMRIAQDILKDDYLAEDAVQEAFMKLADHIEKTGEIESLRTKRFLYTLTKNASIDIYRKRKKQFEREVPAEDTDMYRACSVCQEEEENRVIEILKKLPDRYRDVFLLKYSSGYKNKEIAKLLGVPEGTIRQRIARGKVMIEDALKRMEGTEQ